jgi:alpha-tubulin suppressor-like RCC1 family protein
MTACRGETVHSPAPVSSVVITTRIDAIVLGTSAQLEAKALAEDGSILADRPIQWASSNIAVAQVSSLGVLSPVSTGQTIISAICEGKAAEILIRVTPSTVNSIVITPANPVVMVGDSIQLRATLKDAWMNDLPPKAVTWMVTTKEGTTVSSTGMVHTVVPAVARVVAEVDGIRGEVFVRILSSPAATIDLEPSYQLVFPAGREDTWTSGHVWWTARDANGQYTGDAVVTLTSSNQQVAEVKPNGVIVGLAASPLVTITATSGTAVSHATTRIIAAAAIRAGDSHMCFVSDLAEAYCWGRNVNGELGIGESDTVTTLPRKVRSDAAFADLSLGDAHSCGVSTAGEAYCWGANENGQLGDGSRTSHLTPVPVAGGVSFGSVASGVQQTCGLSLDRAVYCWGLSIDGNVISVPHRLDFAVNFSSLVVGRSVQCGLDGDGIAWCWGANNEGQAGIGQASDPLPKPVPVAGARRYSQIVATFSKVCALSTEGDTFCWGSGVAWAANAAAPVQVAPGFKFTRISASRTALCGVTADDVTMCAGELPGDGTNDSGTQFVRTVSQYTFFPSNYSGVAVGYRSRCVITRPGMPMCWGLGAGNAAGPGTVRNPFVVRRPPVN